MTTSIKKLIVFFFQTAAGLFKKIIQRDYLKKAGCVLDPQIKTVAEKKAADRKKKKKN